MGCTRAELHVWPGPGSQRRSFAASQALLCKVGAVPHARWAAGACPVVVCVCVVVGGVCVACWPAVPLAARCVSRSWSVSKTNQADPAKTEYAIGLPYSSSRASPDCSAHQDRI